MMSGRSNADFQVPDRDPKPDLSDLDEHAARKAADRKREAETADARDDDAVEQETENTFDGAEDLPGEDSN